MSRGGSSRCSTSSARLAREHGSACASSASRRGATDCAYGPTRSSSGFGRTLGPALKPARPPAATLAFLRDALQRNAAAAKQRRLVVVETTTLDIARGQPAISHIRDGAGGRRACDHREQGPGRVRVPRAGAGRGASGSTLPVRGRGDGRRADLQPGARDAAGRADHRLPRRRQQHDELHPDRDGTGPAVRRRARARCRRAASRRRMRRSTSTAGTRPRRPRRSPTSCSARTSRRSDVDRRGIGRGTGRAGAPGAGRGPAAEAGGAGAATRQRRGASRRGVAAGGRPHLATTCSARSSRRDRQNALCILRDATCSEEIADRPARAVSLTPDAPTRSLVATVNVARESNSFTVAAGRRCRVDDNQLLTLCRHSTESPFST